MNTFTRGGCGILYETSNMAAVQSSTAPTAFACKWSPYKMKYVRAAVGLAIAAASSTYVCQAQSPQRYNIQPDSVSLSGISSGADFRAPTPRCLFLENPRGWSIGCITVLLRERGSF